MNAFPKSLRHGSGAELTLEPNLAQRDLSVVHRCREREEEEEAAVQKQHDPLVELAINIRVRGRDVEVELPSRKRR